MASTTASVRTRIMPRWMAFLTYALALLLLLTISQNLWVTPIFPCWVLIVSIYSLAMNLRGQGTGALDNQTTTFTA